MPQKGQATRATSSSTKPRVPTRSPTLCFMPSKSVITNETLLFRKTRKEMEKRQTARRYVEAWRVEVAGAKGRYLDMGIVEWRLSGKLNVCRTGWTGLGWLW